MAHAENEVTVNGPVNDVFAFIADGLNNPRWRTGVVSIKLAAGKAGKEGARYAQMMKGPGGRNISGDYLITTLIQNKELSFAVISGPARPTGKYLFESVKNGTKVKFILDLKLKGFAKIMDPIITKSMNSEVGQLANLVKALE